MTDVCLKYIEELKTGSGGTLCLWAQRPRVSTLYNTKEILLKY